MAGPRDSKRYSEAQIQAMLKAHIIDGHKGSEVVRMAAAGTLGIPAFTIDKRYVYQVLNKNREAFELDHPDVLAKSTQDELKRLHVANLRASRALAKDTDPQERARIAKALADTGRAFNASITRTATPNNTPPGPATPEGTTASVVTDLLTRTKQGQRAGSQPRAQTGDASSDAA